MKTPTPTDHYVEARGLIGHLVEAKIALHSLANDKLKEDQKIELEVLFTEQHFPNAKDNSIEKRLAKNDTERDYARNAMRLSPGYIKLLTQIHDQKVRIMEIEMTYQTNRDFFPFVIDSSIQK